MAKSAGRAGAGAPARRTTEGRICAGEVIFGKPQLLTKARSSSFSNRADLWRRFRMSKERIRVDKGMSGMLQKRLAETEAKQKKMQRPSFHKQCIAMLVAGSLILFLTGSGLALFFFSKSEVEHATHEALSATPDRLKESPERPATAIKTSINSNKFIAATLDVKSARVIRINAGGTQLIDSQNNTWEADNYYNVGTVASVTSNIDGTLDDGLYRVYRWDPPTLPELTYNIPLDNGKYEVKLHFVEAWSGAFTPGVRVFNVNLEDTRVLTNFDIASQVGANTALIKTFNTTVTDHDLTISFEHISNKNNPLISAIEIREIELFKKHP